MRKGFMETLATVAIAMLGFNAMAMAPTVGDIPDIVIGDFGDVSGTNVFVFEDAIDLNRFVDDDETEPGSIIWSYSVTDPNDNRYTLNAVPPLDIVGGDDPILPDDKRVDTQDNDPTQQDGNPRTVTFRDELRSPVATGSGMGPYPDPAGGPGVLPDSRTITVYASDGSTVGLGSFIIYTEDEAFDSFSPPEETVLDLDFTAGASGWTFAAQGGTVTGNQTSSGLCIDVPATGENDGVWVSPYDIIELQQNSVWEARMTVSTTQTTAFQTPLWQFVYDNVNSDGSQGQNEYGGQMFYHDNEGGANSPIAGIGRSDFRMFMTPPAFQVPHFTDETNGFFSPALDDNNDMRLQFRILDFDSVGYGAEVDQGSVCFQDLQVVRHDVSTMQNLETVFQVTSFENAHSGAVGSSGPNGYYIDGDAQTNIDFSGGNATLSSNGNAWNNNTVTLFRPGDGRDFDPTNAGGVNNDLWPIAWEANTTYYVEFELSAPTATDESNPPDVIRVGADTITAELVMDHSLVPNTPDFSTGSLNTRGLSMPRTGTPQKYGAFFYSHSQTESGINDPQRWRPRFEVLTSNALNPIGRTDNTGAVRVHSVTVQKVSFGG